MNKTYWIVRYKAKGKRRAHPIVTTLRCTRTESIAATECPDVGRYWNGLKQEFDLECVKVRILDPAPVFKVSQS